MRRLRKFQGGLRFGAKGRIFLIHGKARVPRIIQQFVMVTFQKTHIKTDDGTKKCNFSFEPLVSRRASRASTCIRHCCRIYQQKAGDPEG